MDWSIHGGGVQGYTLRKNECSVGGWDSVNRPVSPRGDILRDWTRRNNLPSIIQLMRMGVNFDFRLDGATASLGSVLVYEAPLINSVFVVRASTTLASVSKASVEVDDSPRSTLCSAQSSGPDISEAYSIIGLVVGDKDNFVWHGRLGQLSLPAIKRLPNTVRDVQLHANSPSTCTCEVCIMGKMFRKPFQPLRLEHKAKTWGVVSLRCDQANADSDDVGLTI